jgi:alpha-glucosidase (family GH31 glycosyl hydrolase)
MRPMFFEFPDDANCEKFENQFMLGPALMVASVNNAS